MSFLNNFTKEYLFEEIVRLQKVRFLIGVFLLIFNLLSVAGIPYLMKLIIDGITLGDYETTWFYLYMMITLVAISLIVSSVSSLTLNKLLAISFINIRKKIISKISKIRYEKLNKYPESDLLNRIVHELSSIQRDILNVSLSIIGGFLNILISLTIIFILNPFIGLLVVFFMPIYVVSTYILGNKLNFLSREYIENQTNTINNGYLFLNRRLVSAVYNFKRFWDNVFYQLFSKAYELDIKIGRNYVANEIVQKVLSNVSLIIIIIIGIQSTLSQMVTVGTMIALITYMNQVFNPIQGLIGNIMALRVMQVSTDRIEEILVLQEESTNKESLELPFETIKKLSMKNVDYTYYNSNSKIHIATATFVKGKVNFLLGNNGTGKTTLLKLLLGAYRPEKGKLFINDKEISFDILTVMRKKVGVVFREGNLIPGDINDNFGLSLSSKELLQKIKDIIGENANKVKDLDFQSSVSTGQEYIISVMRAILHNKEVLILDEVISNLDHNYREIIMPLLRRLSEDKIIIIITHENELITESDNIVSLN
ncbi:ABC transporter ATP-binding protein [Ornithinibacillus sp. FSL M8-0202]|uniref:ABC transporter ATP-binding protein n=1 Tax=Ornithinibacillus sp. FSL M8-0202 TaxID=2921616 RepID=UPI0030CB9384